MPVGLIFAGVVGGLASHLIYGNDENIDKAIKNRDKITLNTFPKDDNLILSLKEKIVYEKNKEDRDFIIKFVDENLSKDLIESFYSEVILKTFNYIERAKKKHLDFMTVMTEVLSHLRSYRCSFFESLYKNLLDKIEDKIMRQIPDNYTGYEIQSAGWKKDVKQSLWEDHPEKVNLKINNYHTNQECDLIDDPLYKAFKSILAVYNLNIKDIKPKMSTQ